MGLRISLLKALEKQDISASDREKILSKLLNYSPEWAESQLETGEEALYAGIQEAALSTPFYDYYQVLLDLRPGERLVDLGGGHCKGSLLSAALGRSSDCLSLEISSKRIEGARRTLSSLGLESSGVLKFNILRDRLPLVEAYFVYLPLGELIYRPIQQLLKNERSARFYVVESHGDMLDFFDSLSKWFRPLKVIPSEGQRHKSGVSVYQFEPRSVQVEDLNSPDFLYEFVFKFSKERQVRLKKESGEINVKMKDLLPLLYNGQMSFECLSLKRIVDYQNVRYRRSLELYLSP